MIPPEVLKVILNGRLAANITAADKILDHPTHYGCPPEKVAAFREALIKVDERALADYEQAFALLG